MAKDNKAPAASKLPSAVPGSSAPPAPAKTPARSPRRVARRHSTFPNTILSDPITIEEGIRAKYEWDDPSVAVPDEPELAEPAGAPASPPTTAAGKPAVPASPPPPAPAAVTQSGAAHSPVTLYQAKSLGISEAEIADCTPKELERLVMHGLSVREEMRREFVIDDAKRRQQGAPSGSAATATAAPADSTSAAPGGPKVEDPLALPWGTDEEGKSFEDAVHPSIAAVVKHLAKQNADLTSKVEQLLAAETQRGQLTAAQKLDNLFARNPDVFGTEPGSKLPPTSPAKQKMLAVIKVMEALAGGSMDERFEEAHRILYGELPGGAAPASQPSAAAPPAGPANGKPLPPRREDGTFRKPKPGEQIHDDDVVDEAEVNRWAGSGSALPTHRNEPTEKGKKAATQSVDRLLRENPDILGEGTSPADDYAGEFLSSNGAL